MKNFKLRAIEKLGGKTFRVERYQRGYKWGILEVLALLEDIHDFDDDSQSFYCLQPVVVKRLEKDIFELIDGQQRLTTIYIILRCLDVALFDLSYRTRDQSEAFLRAIDRLTKLELDLTQSKNKLSTRINEGWAAYIIEKPSDDNVDNYHFYTAYQVIRNWIDRTTSEYRQVFQQKILKDTRVIWYRVISKKEPEDIFIDFNQGKIQLEQAELIKALFVLKLKKEPNTELRAYRMNQFADEWNTIENQLQDDRFWYFVSNDRSDRKQANRIDLLFDIICEKKKREENQLFAYHYYLKALSGNEAGDEHWLKINTLFNLLYEWYNDRTIYHLLGLLIFFGSKSIAEVYRKYEDLKDKGELKKSIRHWIREGLKMDEPGSKYRTLNVVYGDPEAFTLLVIFNVATYQTSDFNYRFPFNKLKTQSWSLEHIHAQKADEFKTYAEITDWIADIRNLIKTEKEANETAAPHLAELAKDVSGKDPADNINRAIMDKAKALNQLLNTLMDVDSIRNLCLLDGPTNSALSNLNFRNKRKKLLAIDGQGKVPTKDGGSVKTFIPLCSKYVFLKYYTKNADKIQFTYWGATDRNDYEEKLGTVVAKYLK